MAILVYSNLISVFLNFSSASSSISTIRTPKCSIKTLIHSPHCVSGRCYVSDSPRWASGKSVVLLKRKQSNSLQSFSSLGHRFNSSLISKWATFTPPLPFFSSFSSYNLVKNHLLGFCCILIFQSYFSIFCCKNLHPVLKHPHLHSLTPIPTLHNFPKSLDNS